MSKKRSAPPLVRIDAKEKLQCTYSDVIHRLCHSLNAQLLHICRLTNTQKMHNKWINAMSRSGKYIAYEDFQPGYIPDPEDDERLAKQYTYEQIAISTTVAHTKRLNATRRLSRIHHYIERQRETIELFKVYYDFLDELNFLRMFPGTLLLVNL